MKNLPIIAPSILSADPGHYARDISSICADGADWLHIDVMDGSFVPPITFGDNIVKLAKNLVSTFLDVHLMIAEPEKHVASFIAAGSNMLTVHYEACSNPQKTLQMIRSAGAKAGLAIKPNTAWQTVLPLLAYCDLVLVMTVEPGWGGQKFMPAMLNKVENLKTSIKQQNLPTLIEVDGGINEETTKQCLNAGADVLVAGSYIFGSSDRRATIDALRSQCL